MGYMRAPNFYSGGGLDRCDERRADETWLAERLRDRNTHFVAVWRSRNFIALNDSNDVTPRPAWLKRQHVAALIEQAETWAFLGMRAEYSFVALDLSRFEAEDLQEQLPAHGSFRDLREVGPLMGHGDGAVLAYARGLMHWHRNHLFCGACGSPTASENAGHLRRCRNSKCGKAHFPRTDPAVIMLIHDGGNHCVLGRQHNWPSGMHSTLAGFLEPGESLEDAVAREVYEEIGLRVSDVRYHSSQPWPFPSSMMIGFHAQTRHEPLRINPDELESAKWFSRTELAASPEDETLRLPRKDSIARRLVGDWLTDS